MTDHPTFLKADMPPTATIRNTIHSPFKAQVQGPQPHFQSDPPRAARIPALDGLRGIAILMVLVYHLAPRSESNSTASAIITNLLDLGKYGVDLFFVLSGFLITGILLQSTTRPGYLTHFFIRRSLRIFPLYYALLFLLFIALPFAHIHEFERARADQMWFWLYLVNISAGLHKFPYASLNHLWSLAVEQQFYLLWPFIVLGLSRPTLARTCYLCIALAFATRMFLTLSQHSPALAYTLTPCRMDSLLAGALIAIYASRPKDMNRAAPLTHIVFPAIGTVYFLTYAFFANSKSLKTAITLIGPTILAFTFATAVIACINGRNRFAIHMRSPILITFGKYSYALYLFHPLLSHVGHAIVNHLARRPGFLHNLAPTSLGWIAMPLTLSLSFASAYASWHLFEKRFLRLNRFFPEKSLILPETGCPQPGNREKRSSP